jgi:hypothetical protein
VVPDVLIVIDAKSRADEIIKNVSVCLGDGSRYERHEGGIALSVQSNNKMMTVKSSPGRDIILLGNIVSEQVAYEDVLGTVTEVIEDENYDALKQLQGVFVLLIIDWTLSRVVVISDLLGIRPFYNASQNGTVVLTDRAEVAAQIIGPKVDPVGLGTWLYFGAPLVQRSIFDDVHRLAPASVSFWEKANSRQVAYWTPEADEQEIDREELMDGLSEDFSASLSRLLAPYDSATSLLSGGFDSRFSLLTALRNGQENLKAITFPYTAAERQVVDDLVAATGIECKRIKVDGSLWDAFDSMWYRHPDGFPVTRNLTYLCVTSPEAEGPFIDGSIASVSAWCHSADPPDGPPATESAAREFVWKAHAKCCPTFCFNDIALQRLEELARQGANELSDVLGWDSKFCLKWDMYQDERRFTPVNFLQYADIAVSVQPFYGRALIERRLRHPNKMFDKKFYHGMLRRHFSGPGGLPHASDLAKGNDTVYLYSHTLQKQLPALIRFVVRNRSVLKAQWLLPRLLSYGVRSRRHMYVAHELNRLLQMEQELKRLQIAGSLSGFVSGLGTN